MVSILSILCHSICCVTLWFPGSIFACSLLFNFFLFFKLHSQRSTHYSVLEVVVISQSLSICPICVPLATYTQKIFFIIEDEEILLILILLVGNSLQRINITIFFYFLFLFHFFLFFLSFCCLPENRRRGKNKKIIKWFNR